MIETPTFLFALREDLKDEEHFLPTRAHDNDTGYDVRFAPEDRHRITIRPFEYVKLPLGYRAFIPDGWWYKLVPRSSTFAKKSLHALYGTIDEGFEREAVFACQYIPPLSYDIECNCDGINWREPADWKTYCSSRHNQLEIDFGEAIGQIIPVKRQSMNVSKISNKDIDIYYKQRNGSRGTGGFGSSNK